jgi:predicted nucleotidyltransferase
MKKNEALRIAKEYAVRVRTELDSDAEIYLFGSAVRDEMQEHSDIDVAVVSKIFGDNVVDNRVKLMLLSNVISYDIEPHPVLREDWVDVTPFTREIKNEGISI